MALAPTLVVAVGGSGFQTLCYLKAELKRMLAEDGWEGALPKAWQFVAVDMQPHAIYSLDSTFSNDFEQMYGESAIEGITYINLVAPGTKYDDIIQLLQNRITPETFIDQLSGWLPRWTAVPIVMGSGQISSIGRAVLLSSLDRLAQELNEIRREMLSPQAEIELQQVRSFLGENSIGIKSQPIGVVLSSIAGGFGSSCFLDVEKMICDQVPGGIYTFLQSPSVFQLDIQDVMLRSTNWNAYSALCAMTKDLESGAAWGEVSKCFGVLAPSNNKRCRFVVEPRNHTVALKGGRFEIFKETAAFVAQLIGDANFAREVQFWNLDSSHSSTLLSPVDSQTDPLIIDSRRHGGFQRHSKLVPAQRVLGIGSFQACLTSGVVTEATNPFDTNVFHRTLRDIFEEYFRMQHIGPAFRSHLSNFRAKPLNQFIPLPTSKLNAFIKGWTLARFLDEIRFEADSDGRFKCSVLANIFAKDQEQWTYFQDPVFKDQNHDYEGDTGLIATIKSLGLALVIGSFGTFGLNPLANPLLPYQTLIGLGELEHTELSGLIQARGFESSRKKDIYALKEYLSKVQINLEESISTERSRLTGNPMEHQTGRYELRNLLHQAIDDLANSVESHIQELARDNQSG